MEILHKNEKRVNDISEFMRQLLAAEGSGPKRALYDQYQERIADIEAIDLFYFEMYKHDTSSTIEEIKESAGKFVNVFHHSLQEKQGVYNTPFLQNFLAESKAIESHLNTLKPYFNKSLIQGHRDDLIRGFERCLDIEKKFIKKEHILFPHLESKLPSTKPLEVLWSLHDDARTQVKTILLELRKETLDITGLFDLIGQYYYSIFGLHQKEELILLPVASKLLSIPEQETMYHESLSYGYAFMEQPLPIAQTVIKEKEVSIEGMYHSATGNLSFEQLTAVFQYLPVDITFVDKDDKVCYYNNRKERHFPRNPSIIGRLVKYCHPPKSVHVVEEIVNSFKDHSKDTAEFWISIKDVFLYINYFAIRDMKGNYLGTLEVSQDVTKIRALTGEQRILDWKK